jgi:hypothetical protein
MRRSVFLLPLLIAAAPAPEASHGDWNARFLTLSNDEYLWRLADSGQPTERGPAAIMPPHLPDVSPQAQAGRGPPW